jgi:methionyl-tRNA formyltransferase
MRILFFGTGGRLSAAGLRALAAEHDVVGVVRARRSKPRGAARRVAGQVARWVGLREPDPLTAAARSLHVPESLVPSVRDERFVQAMAARRPDLLCIAHFPWRLPDELLGIAPLGGINVHPSLLPRHRGPLPLCWVYHADDRETGVTVHHLTSEMDAGDIIACRSFALPRAYPVDHLNADNARVGAEVLQSTIRAIAQGTAQRRPQDESQVTFAPLVRPGDRLVDFDAWDAERVWHFLAGVWPRFREPLRDGADTPVTYGGVLGFDAGSSMAPLGRVRQVDAGRLALGCRDGMVWLRTAPAGDPTGRTR